MGILRLLLALSVLTAHSPWGSHLAGGPLAVECFFVVSGFYMALLLDRKVYPTTLTFYAARWWRLWPLFILVGVVVLVARHFGGAPWLPFVMVQPLEWGWLAGVSNVVMAGMDGLFYGEYYAHAAVPGHTGNLLLLIPQAWSLALEFYFVLLAPALNRLSTRWLWALVVGTQVARWVGLACGLDAEFWGYRFFGFEAGLFVLGMIYWRAWQHKATPQARVAYGRVAPLAWMAVATALLWPMPIELTRVVLLGIVALMVPALFERFKGNKLDRFIGELSYPFYLWHLLVLNVCEKVFAAQSAGVMTLVAIAITLALSVVSQVVVQAPIDGLRHRLARGRV